MAENGNSHINHNPEDGFSINGKMIDHVDCPEEMESSEIKHRIEKKDTPWWKSFYRNVPDDTCGIWSKASKYIYSSKESKFRRFGWTFIILFSMSALIAQISDRIIHFSTFPIYLDISVDQKATSVTFPKVIICNFNAFVKSKTLAMPVFDKLLRSYENQHMRRVNDTFPWTEEEILEIREMNMANVTRALAHEKENMFLSVTFAGQPLSIDDIVPVFTDVGLCYQINDGLDGRQLLKTQGGGKSTGLILTLNTEQEEYYYNSYILDKAGFTIQLLDQDETPLVIELGFDIGPGTSTAVATTVTQVFNEEPPYGVCGKKKLKYFERYSQYKCFMECITDLVVDKCGCRRPSQPGNATVCNPFTMQNCTQPVLDCHAEYFIQVCQCPLECSNRKFTSSLSSAKFPSKFRARLIEEYIDEGVLNYSSLDTVNSSVIEENFAVVNIFFPSSTTRIVTQQAAYPFFALLSDIGGAIGLWVGSSLLSIYELLDVCGNSCSRRHRTPNPPTG